MASTGGPNSSHSWKPHDSWQPATEEFVEKSLNLTWIPAMHTMIDMSLKCPLKSSQFNVVNWEFSEFLFHGRRNIKAFFFVVK